MFSLLHGRRRAGMRVASADGGDGFIMVMYCILTFLPDASRAFHALLFSLGLIAIYLGDLACAATAVAFLVAPRRFDVPIYVCCYIGKRASRFFKLLFSKPLSRAAAGRTSLRRFLLR